MSDIAEKIRNALTPDLLKPKWRRIAEQKNCRVTGHCYAASEAVFHLLGGAKAGWVPQVLSHKTWPKGLKAGQTHWFIKNYRTGAVIDATSEQFLPLVPDYPAATGSGFLTREPSKRASVIMERVLASIAN